MKATDSHINYIELLAHDLEKTKAFYTSVFNWKFTDYGPNYIAFDNCGLQGGFEKTDQAIVNGALVVLYHSDLETIKTKVEAAGAIISKEIFDFPGGRRFHFIDPSGNDLAIWSDK
ncbi:MAG: putative enzyme related to lactoylglutathione lyase [Crocinitomix sp.]|jgi:predicted enzyme related to lactoylglutathione lyase